MKNTEIRRMSVNQPSTLQLLHDLHGTNVIAVPEGEDFRELYT